MGITKRGKVVCVHDEMEAPAAADQIVPLALPEIWERHYPGTGRWSRDKR
jgi:hypothetical protein